MDRTRKDYRWWRSFLEEPSGKGSVKRLMMLIITMTFVFVYLRIALFSSEILDIPPNWAYLLAGMLGLGIVDRIIQQKNKNKDEE